MRCCPRSRVPTSSGFGVPSALPSKVRITNSEARPSEVIVGSLIATWTLGSRTLDQETGETGKPILDIADSEPAMTRGLDASEGLMSSFGASGPVSAAWRWASAAHIEESGIQREWGLICAVGSSLATSAALRDSTWICTHRLFTTGCDRW